MTWHSHLKENCLSSNDGCHDEIGNQCFSFFFFCCCLLIKVVLRFSLSLSLSLSLSHTHTHTHTHSQPDSDWKNKSQLFLTWTPLQVQSCLFLKIIRKENKKKNAVKASKFFSRSVSHKPHNVQGYQSVIFSILILPYLLSRPWQEEIGVETDEDSGAVLPSWTDIIHLALIHSLSHGTKGISVAISKHSISSPIHVCT